MTEQYDDQYKALGTQHHDDDSEIEPLESTDVGQTIMAVGLFIACFVSALLMIGVIR